MRKSVTNDDVDTLNGYLVALEGSKTDEEKLKRLRKGVGKLEEVFEKFGSQFRLDVTRPIRQLLGTVQQVSQRSQQKATHASPNLQNGLTSCSKMHLTV